MSYGNGPNLNPSQARYTRRGPVAQCTRHPQSFPISPNSSVNPSHPSAKTLTHALKLQGCANSTARSASPSSGTSNNPDRTVSATRIATGSSRTRRSNASSHQPPHANQPRRPLRAPRPYHNNDSNPTHALWTPASLRRERRIFFETRVSGAPEIWQAVALAVDMVRGPAHDLIGAQSVLDAAGVIVPRGRLEEGAWDERGMLYALPPWVLSDPVDLPLDDDDDEEEGSDGVGAAGDEDDLESVDKEVLGEGSTGELVSIRARLSDRGTDVIFPFDKERSVLALARAVREAADISPKTKIKIAYLGRILKDNQSLTAQGWEKGHVLNALVFA